MLGRLDFAILGGLVFIAIVSLGMLTKELRKRKELKAKSKCLKK